MRALTLVVDGSEAGHCFHKQMILGVFYYFLRPAFGRESLNHPSPSSVLLSTSIAFHPLGVTQEADFFMGTRILPQLGVTDADFLVFFCFFPWPPGPTLVPGVLCYSHTLHAPTMVAVRGDGGVSFCDFLQFFFLFCQIIYIKFISS